MDRLTALQRTTNKVTCGSSAGALGSTKPVSFPDQASLFDVECLDEESHVRSVLDTAVLVERIREGRPGSTDAMFAAYGRYIERLLVRVVGPDPEIEDLLHEVFAQALSGIGQLRDPSLLKPWLTRITVHVARGALRKRTRRRALVFVQPDALDEHTARTPSPEAVDLLERVFDVLQGLRPNQRLAFSLRYIEGMTLAECAEASGVSLATFKRWLRAANRSFVSRSRKMDRALYEELLATPRWGGAQ